MTKDLRREKIRSVMRVSTGNFLEMYDFMIVGYYAAAIGRTFFPKSSEFASLMYSLATFGAGFLMRPIGALLLGAYTDSHGRRAGLIVTLALMSVGTLSIAATPGYRTLGVVAPLVILLGRLIQGFSAGVELGGVSVYLSEIAVPGRKGFYVSWQSASQQLAVVLAALSGVTLHSFLTSQQIDAWGWRAPLVFGCLIIPFLFLLRRSLTETQVFQERKRHPRASEILLSTVENWRLVLMGTMLVTMTTVSFYMITAYTPTFGHSTLHLAEKYTLFVTLCVGISNFVWLPVMGALSDKVGRLPLLVGCAVLALLTAYPALSWLAAGVAFNRLLAVELWLSFIYGGYNGAALVYLTEIMPVEVRASGFSLAYSLATALFGGFTPMVATYLIEVTHNKAMPGVLLSGAAAIGLAAALWSSWRLRIEPLPLIPSGNGKSKSGATVEP
jgi:MFS family permease